MRKRYSKTVKTSSPIEWGEALAEAAQAQALYRQDGNVPSRQRILAEMGRKPNGEPLPKGTTGTSAREAARKLVNKYD